MRFLFDKAWFDSRIAHDEDLEIGAANPEFARCLDWATRQSDINVATNIVTCNLLALTSKIERGEFSLARILELIEESPVNEAWKEKMKKELTKA